MPSPLFRNFQARRKAAQAQAKATAQRAGKKLTSQLKSSRSLREVRSQAEKLIDAAAKQLGKVGPLLKMLLRIGKASPDETLEVMQQAVKDSGQQAPAITPKPQSGRSQPPRKDPPEVTFREAPRPEPRGPNVISVPIGGRQRRYDLSDPTVSGEMIEVQSSNVHSIGFDFNFDNPIHGTLKVRFLQGAKDKKTAGPLYHYENVHPDVFEAFKTAASKGKFVWDRLRIRGTVTGHQYRYKLAGITGRNVPRQAKKYGPNQYFVQRRFKGTRNGEIREFQSELPDQRVGTYQPRNSGRPNRGLPNRGS